MHQLATVVLRFMSLCCGHETGPYLRLTDPCITHFRLKDIVGPVMRVKKKQKKKQDAPVGANCTRVNLLFTITNCEHSKQ